MAAVSAASRSGARHREPAVPWDQRGCMRSPFRAIIMPSSREQPKQDQVTVWATLRAVRSFAYSLGETHNNSRSWARGRASGLTRLAWRTDGRLSRLLDELAA